jgi:flagellar protein FliT
MQATTKRRSKNDAASSPHCATPGQPSANVFLPETRKPIMTSQTAAVSPSPSEPSMNNALLQYYEAIETASRDMLDAARAGDWDRVVKLEGACAVLISQLKHAASEHGLGREEAQLKSRIMQRILVNDAEVRVLAEPWLEDLDKLLAGQPRNVLH